jgi:hypothetical protein
MELNLNTENLKVHEKLLRLILEETLNSNGGPDQPLVTQQLLVSYMLELEKQSVERWNDKEWKT